MYYRPFDRSTVLWIINEFLKWIKWIKMSSTMSGSGLGYMEYIRIWRVEGRRGHKRLGQLVPWMNLVDSY